MLTAKQWDKLYDVLSRIAAEDMVGVSYRGAGVFSFSSIRVNDEKISGVKYWLLRRLGDEYNIALTAMMLDGHNQIILNFEFSLK